MFDQSNTANPAIKVTGVRSWHCSISSISRMWKKYQQTCNTMIVNLIRLQL